MTRNVAALWPQRNPGPILGALMHLCFIDESGTPPSRPSVHEVYFTLAAVIIRDHDWSEIAKKLLGFCLRHNIRGELKWRYFSPHNATAENPLLGSDAATRKRLSLELAHLILASELTVVACVTDVGVAFEYASVSNQQELYHFTYKPVTERFQYFLQDNGSQGIVIADHRGRDSDKLFRAHHQSLLSKRGKATSAYNRFIEGLFLQDSRHSVGIQLADLVAGAIHRAYTTGDAEIATLIRPKIRRSDDGKILGHGIVQHPRDRFRTNLRRGGRRAGP